MDGWGKIKPVAKYAGISERTLRGDWLKNGLKHVRLPSGTVLLKYEWVDRYLESFTSKNDLVDRIVNETIKGLR